MAKSLVSCFFFTHGVVRVILLIILLLICREVVGSQFLEMQMDNKFLQ